MVKKALPVLAIILSFTGLAQAQVGITSVPFLQIEPDSRAAGMGNSGVAIADNAAAVFWNPAGLAFQEGNQVGITHSEWLPQFNADLFYDYLVGKYHVDGIGTFGGHITYLNLGEQTYTDADGFEQGRFNSYEFAVGASYGFEMNKHLSLGTGIRYIYSSLADGEFSGRQINPGSSVGIDLAGMYKTSTFTFMQQEASWSAGLNISNIGPGLKYTSNAQKDPLPTVFRLGWAYTTTLDPQGISTLTIANDYSKVLARVDEEGNPDGMIESLFSSWGTFDRDIGGGRVARLNPFQQLMISTGLEYWYDELIAFRGGYYYEDPNNGNREFMTFGAGLRYDFLGVDFSYIYTLGDDDHPLANTTRFGLILDF